MILKVLQGTLPMFFFKFSSMFLSSLVCTEQLKALVYPPGYQIFQKCLAVVVHWN